MFQLACFDMDGTLIRNTNSVRYLCCLNGKEDEALEIELISGIDDVIKRLKGDGMKTILITAGPVQVAGIMKEKFGFDEAYGSNYDVSNGNFTGRILEHLGEGGKLRSLVSFCAKNEIDLQRTIAIGDSASDIEVFQKSGKSIAINYTDELIGNASVYLKTNTLTDILRHL
ncbi:MAG: Phosphoserine phosphatase [Firmicutes bacterium]|nr:Phosphoserine phosphatase [Bacillota bacterium]MDI6704827.1 HAD-IB family phosphatase [Bacillota bacterium]